MPDQLPNDHPAAEIRAILEESQTVAVVGLSGNEDRPSHGVAQYLQRHGYRIVPVNPNEKEVLGEKAYASLRDIPFPIDTVDIFRKPESVLEIVQEAIEIGAKAIWMQLGVSNPEAAMLARSANMKVVENHCIAVEHLQYRVDQKAKTSTI